MSIDPFREMAAALHSRQGFDATMTKFSKEGGWLASKMIHHRNKRAPPANDDPNKVTAAQIEKVVGLPPRLQEIGDEINARLAKVDRALEQVENHKIAIDQLLEEAKALCDEGGFKLFKKKFCPALGKSRSYELLAIAAGKKTIEQTKAETRKRQTRHRAKTKAKLAEAKAKLAEIEAAEAERPLVTDKSKRPLVTDKPEHKAVAAKDIALREFDEKILRFVQMTRGHKPKRFAKTSVHTSDLSQLGRFLEKVAAAASTETMKAEHAQLSDAEQKAHAGDLETVS
jgi:hypothetical protein